MQFPFALSSHKRLNQLSISASILSAKYTETIIGFECELPAITSLIKMAPGIRDVVLRLHWLTPNYSSLGQLDWSILQSDLRPPIYLFVSCDIKGHSISPRSILSALSKNTTLMDLVKRRVVILKPEPIAPEDLSYSF